MKPHTYEITFNRIASLEPDKGIDGKIKEYLPQSRYKNAGGLQLHKYGRGPFCRFRIANDQNEAGVYIFAIDGTIKYAGECLDLSRRINTGYGNISPRNCFEGGQSTNCRLNNLVLQKIKEGNIINLYFYATGNRKKVEADLLRKYQPVWNLQLVGKSV